MRYIYQEAVQDGKGLAIEDADVTVYLAGGTTKATIYTAFTGGTADADSVIETGSDGTYAFYVDEDDYPHSQQFKTVMSKSGYTPETWDYLQIFPTKDRTLITDSAVDQGDSSIIGTLAWHISDASGANVTVHGLISTPLISQNITIPATMTYKPVQGCVLTDDGNDADLTINGPLEAGLYQIFDWGNGSGAVTFGNIIDGARPEWWYSTGSYHTAINAADASYDSVFFSNKDYAITSGTTMLANHLWRGVGKEVSLITLTGAITGITFDDFCTIEHLQVEGTDTGGQIGIAAATTGVSKWRLNHVRVDDCDIGVQLSYTWTGTFLMCQLRSNAVGLKFADTVPNEVNNNIRIIGGAIHSNSDVGILIDIGSGAMNNILIEGVLMESNANYGIHQADGTMGELVVRNSWFESCGIGMQFEHSSHGITIENNRFYLTNSVNSHAIVFTDGFHNGTLIARNDIDGEAAATVAIELNADQIRPRVEYNSIDAALSITDSSTLSMLYIDKDGLMRLPGVTSIAGGSIVTGNNFTGKVTLSNPNTTAAVSFGTNEPDTNYGVYVAAPGWAAGHIWVTSKAVGGFTINVETTRPSGGESVYWMIIRR